MKTQPQQLLEAIVPQETPEHQPVPEWVDVEWRKEIAEKWAIKVAGEMLASAARSALDTMKREGGNDSAMFRLEDGLERWEKANPPLKGWDQ